MSLNGDKVFKMKMREVENAFRYRRIPYPKRSIEIITLLAISCTLFLFFHTNKLNSRLKEMEEKLQPSEFTALGLTGSRSGARLNDANTLQGTYQYLKNTGQRHRRSIIQENEDVSEQTRENLTQTLSKNDANINNNRKKRQLCFVRREETEDFTDNGDKYYDDYNDDNYDDDNDDTDDDQFYNERFSSKFNGLNNTRKAEIEMIFFNRVPKVGSQSLMVLMKRLGRINGYEHARNPFGGGEQILPNKIQQLKLVKDLVSRPRPHAYSQHIAYINFTSFHMPKPIYINLIRDPVERIISWYYYSRGDWYKKIKNDPQKNITDFDTCVINKDPSCDFIQGETKMRRDHRRQSLFFCGQNRKACMPFNTKSVMQKAKRTVEKDYAVVGTWEETNITLAVLENYIPLFFKHASFIYYRDKNLLSKVNKNPNKKPVSEYTREILRKNLTHEIEFYEFCKQRLFHQYAALYEEVKFGDEDFQISNDYEEDDDDYDNESQFSNNGEY